MTAEVTGYFFAHFLKNLKCSLLCFKVHPRCLGAEFTDNFIVNQPVLKGDFCRSVAGRTSTNSVSLNNRTLHPAFFSIYAVSSPAMPPPTINTEIFISPSSRPKVLRQLFSSQIDFIYLTHNLHYEYSVPNNSAKNLSFTKTFLTPSRKEESPKNLLSLRLLAPSAGIEPTTNP